MYSDNLEYQHVTVTRTIKTIREFIGLKLEKQRNTLNHYVYF